MLHLLVNKEKGKYDFCVCSYRTGKNMTQSFENQIKKCPMVSVVLPIYNQEKYLDTSISSVQNQTYANLEIICVNDGSTDSSEAILKKYMEKDNRVIIISKTNGGLVDATIAGVRAARGEYIVFLDPDDYIGFDFVENFLMEIGKNDFLAMGYYRRHQGIITPQYLLENREYNKEDILKYRSKYLYDPNFPGLSNRFFISRWNKMYRTTCVKEIVGEFTNYKDISLGEDSIFTFLVLKYCNSGKSVSRPNSYFYNIGSQTSMMSNGSIEAHCMKAEAAYYALLNLLKASNITEIQADVLYYFLMESLLERLKNSSKSDYLNVLKMITAKPEYINAVKAFSKYGLKSKVFFGIKQNWYWTGIFNWGQELYKNLKKRYGEFKWWFKYICFFVKDVVNIGFRKAYIDGRYRIRRKNAFVDMNKQISKLEKEIEPILKPFLKCSTDLQKCSLERNVFVFWWDGFDVAPIIVKKCLETVKQFYADCNVIEISKNNYKEFTDIHPKILEGFEKGKISIQTFSDILRFNLLKINGGVWIDSTIFFSNKYDVFSSLKNKPIESICFSTSEDFLKYKGESCNWSGYLFASRKNSVFTCVMCEIFEKYYLNKGSYPIYFFIDVALMICKINKIDAGALDNITKKTGDMFFLHRMLNQPVDECSINILKTIPQKLSWQFEPNGQKNTFYERIFKEDCEEC